jgi:hypothetical protein
MWITIVGNAQSNKHSTPKSPVRVPQYIPYRQGKLYGIMDVRTKKLIVQPVYDEVFCWNKSMAEVIKGSKRGVIDYRNHIIVPIKYDDICFDTLNHHKSLIRGAIRAYGTWKTRIPNDQFDWYNLKGDLKFSVKGVGYGVFREDTLTMIRIGDSTCILSISGRFVAYKITKPGSDTVYLRIENNRIVFEVSPSLTFGEEDIYGHITKKDMDTIALRYKSVEKKASNLYLVRSKTGGTGFLADYGFIDSLGKVILPTLYDPYDPDILYGKFNNGRMLMVDKNGRCGYVDTTGKFVIPINFKRAYPFSENRAAFLDSTTQRIGFIDRNGKISIPPKFDLVNGLRCGSRCSVPMMFSEGLCLILSGEVKRDLDFNSVSYTYIDSTGIVKIQLPEEVKGATGFSNGMAMIANAENKIGFIDKTGKIIIPMKYIDDEPGGVTEFRNGFAYIRSKRGYIDRSGYEYFKD